MTVKKTRDTMTPSLARIQRDLDRLAAEAYAYWVSITPKNTGNARRRTRLRGDTIEANYPYAVPLDEGRSKQAPDGMVKPTEKYIQRQADKKIRK